MEHLLAVIIGATLSGPVEQPPIGNLACEVYQVEGTNYFNFVDPTCPITSVDNAEVVVEEVVEEPTEEPTEETDVDHPQENN